jgi:hypothetical protein
MLAKRKLSKTIEFKRMLLERHLLMPQRHPLLLQHQLLPGDLGQK